VSYWRKWEPAEFGDGGGHHGEAVLECGHAIKIRISRAKKDPKRKADDMGRPVQCFCLNCRIARDRA
jgi:hypothetical protein